MSGPQPLAGKLAGREGRNPAGKVGTVERPRLLQPTLLSFPFFSRFMGVCVHQGQLHALTEVRMGQEAGGTPSPPRGEGVSGPVHLQRSCGRRRESGEASQNVPLGKPQVKSVSWSHPWCSLEGCCPTTYLSAVIKMFCICAVQNHSHSPPKLLRSTGNVTSVTGTECLILFKLNNLNLNRCTCMGQDSLRI